MEQKTTKNKKSNFEVVDKIEIAFSRLIGPLAIMKVLDSYKEAHDEISSLLNTITKWGAEFQLKRNLNFITHKELIDVYNRLDKLETSFLYDFSLGDESDLVNQTVIWMWEIMELRKLQIETK